jgi:hypothetical protein
MKNVCERIGRFPAVGESRRDFEMLGAREQRVEDEFIDALGLSVNPHARIEIRWATLDQHDQRVRVGRTRTGNEEE